MIPVWPFLMGATAALTAWGWTLGAWKIPALALLGYVAMRGVIGYIPDGLVEVTACAVWLGIAAAMLYHGGHIPAFFFALSAMTYPVFFMFGLRIEYMGLIAVFADGFAICALLCIGGGLGISHTRSDGFGILGRFAHHSVGVAAREEI